MKEPGPSRLRFPHFAWALTGLALTPLPAGSASAQDAGGQIDPAAFQTPSREFQPEVWWHWIGGNIDEQGLRDDLDWMTRSGVGGVHIFDVSLPGPQIVKTPLRYMSGPWKKAFNAAVRGARARNMTVGIAASPGWSESGGPWVPPEDAMKKVTWSVIDVRGGRELRLRVPMPPTAIGPFLEALPAADPFAAEHTPIKPLYGDIRLLAVRLAKMEPALPVPVITHDGVRTLDTALIVDGALDKPITLPTQLRWIEYRYPHPVTIRSSMIGRLAGTPIEPVMTAPILEAETPAGFQTIATFEAGNAPQQTLSFAPVRSSRFRLRFPAETAAAGRWLSEWRLSGTGAVNRFEDKAAFDQASNYTAIPTIDASGIPSSDVVDLSDRMDRTGQLVWRAPPGQWRIIRFGWSLTGKVNHPAVPEATGLEVDKLDARAVGDYANRYFERMQTAAMLGQAGIGSVTIDSIEVGAQNWTPDMIRAFTRLRGYDPTPYLPTMTGLIIDDAARSDAFLFDFRRTIGDLIAQAHYKTLSDVAHSRGLTVYGEAMEFARTIQGDDMDLRRFADIPMAAMWSYSPAAGPDKTALADMRGAASIAHLLGKKLVAAEVLTSMGALWQYAPSDLRPMIDRAFAAGINKPVIHSSVHQPVIAGGPGQTLGMFGQTFNRTESWAELAKPWMDYITRSSFMLRQGEPVADLLYAYGEDTPLVTLYGGGMPADLPPGYGWDFIDNRSLLSELTVRDGRIITRAGGSYGLLWLGGTSARMTAATLRKLSELVAAGARVAGPRPVGSPSLADDPADVEKLINALWGPAGGHAVAASASPADALAQIGIHPAIVSSDATYEFVQRRTATQDIVFVVNTGKKLLGEVNMQTSIGCPAIWSAHDGTVSPAIWARHSSMTTTVRLDLPPDRSSFIIFDRSRKESCPVGVTRRELRSQLLTASWSLRMPDKSVFAISPGSWTDSPVERLHHFSGTATYSQSIKLNKMALPAGKQHVLDLGNVGDIARVSINGADAGIVWAAPWQLDVTRFLRRGSNRIDVQVTNLWVNQLVGKANAGTALRPAGLLGPVTLRTFELASQAK